MPLIVTHADSFHPDEMLAIALLLKAHHVKVDEAIFIPEQDLPQILMSTPESPSWLIARTRQVGPLSQAKKNKSVYMIDVGADYCPDYLNFDHHHQAFQETWPDGTPMSSTGIVWKYLRHQGKLSHWGTPELLNKIEESLIKPVDAHDNGAADFEFSEWMAGYNRPKNLFRSEVEHAQTTFMRGIEACMAHLDNEIFSWGRKLEAMPILEEAWKNAQQRQSPVVLMERPSPHHESTRMIFEISQGQAELMVTPRHVTAEQPNTWTIITVPESSHQKFSMKCPMPLAWRGRSQFKIPEGEIIFAHKNGFMCVFEGTPAQALACANFILESHQKSIYLSTPETTSKRTSSKL